jgi:putative sigma-54 modulation protein
MQIHITARHIELTPALADYARKKLERIARHFEIVLRAQVILSVEKHRHSAEVVVHAQGHHDFRAREVAGDLYAAIDLAAEKLQNHLAREKDRRVRGRRGGKVNGPRRRGGDGAQGTDHFPHQPGDAPHVVHRPSGAGFGRIRIGFSVVPRP